MKASGSEATARKPQLFTRIWQEDAEPENPFVARVARCCGYDVYGDMLGKAKWVDMLFLLFAGEAPKAKQARLLEDLALALANPGVRDPAVHAAMCAGVTGSPAAAALMAALAVGAGRVEGARDVFMAMQAWESAGSAFDILPQLLMASLAPKLEVWPEASHWPGFDPRGTISPLPIRQTLAHLAGVSPGSALKWLYLQREALEQAAGLPLAMSGIAAAAFHDLGLSPAQGEMMYLLLRLPGAAAHALEQNGKGYQRFPFGELCMVDDPGQKHVTVSAEEVEA